MTRNFTRRTCLGMAAATAVGTRLVVAEQTHTQPAAKPKIDAKGFAGTVRDRLWIAVSLGDETTMTPAESALYLGVPNVVLNRTANGPALTRQVALSLSGFTRVIWPADGQEQYVDVVRPLVAEFPNFMGVLLDGAAPIDSMRIKEAFGHRELWLNVKSETPGELPAYITNIVLWPESDERLEPSLAGLEKQMPAANIILGCLLHKGSMDRMERALKWLRSGRIDGLVFAAGSGIAGDTEMHNHVRQWIAEVGGEKL